jgi:ribosomal protein S18 acetylase RimI-like enzyme
MQYVLANQFSEEKLVQAHNEIFIDYEGVSELSLEQFQAINVQRGVKYEYSIVALEENKIVGLILNAIREYKGILTAYDCGTGVIPEFRGKGIAKELFLKVKQLLLTNNCHKYVLEVIQTNDKACNLYKTQGFEIIREFDCRIVKREDLEKNLSSIALDDLKFATFTTSDFLWENIRPFQQYPPSWQNSNESLKLSPRYTVLTVTENGTITGYAVFNPRSGEIAQIGGKEMKILGTMIFHYILTQYVDIKQIYFINIDSKYEPLIELLAELGFTTFTKQYEMVLDF